MQKIEHNSKNGPGRILHIISSSTIGGAERCFLEMLEAASALGYETAAVCAGGELEMLAGRVCKTVYTVPMADNADLFSVFKLYRIIKKYGPDLCHLHMNRATLLGALAAKLAGVRSVGSIQGEVKPLYALFPDYLTFCSRSVAEFVRSRSRAIARKPSFYLYNCVDCDALDAGAASGGRSFLVKEFGITPDAFVVCQVARLHPNKGHIFLLDALRTNLERIPGLYCLIVGGGDDKYAESLRMAARERNIAGRVIFTGSRLDIAGIVGSVDLFVLPSLQEGIPMTIMEALCLKVPVAAFDVGGIRELGVERAGNDISALELVPVRDTAALAERMYAMYSRYPEYRAAAAAASLYVRRRFGKITYAADIAAIYRLLIPLSVPKRAK